MLVKLGSNGTTGVLLHHSRKHSVVWPPARWHGRYWQKETPSCIIQPPRTSWPLPKSVENVCLHKKLHMNIDGSFIHNCPNLESSKYSSLGEAGALLVKRHAVQCCWEPGGNMEDMWMQTTEWKKSTWKAVTEWFQLHDTVVGGMCRA